MKMKMKIRMKIRMKMRIREKRKARSGKGFAGDRRKEIGELVKGRKIGSVFL